MADLNPTRESILTEVQGWLANRKGVTVDPGAGYMDGADLDSFDVLQMVLFTEGRFGFQFQAEDFANPRFLTLEGLAAIISSRLHAPGGEPKP